MVGLGLEFGPGLGLGPGWGMGFGLRLRLGLEPGVELKRMMVNLVDS